MRSRIRLLLLALVLVVSACGSASVPVRTVVPDQVAGAAHNDTTTPFNVVSVPALIDHVYDGRDLVVDHVMSEQLAVTRHHVSYRSGALEISGVLAVPRRPGRFPLLVLAHGYQRPARYDSRTTLVREQVYLAARGYVVLMPDYRNYGDSDRDGSARVDRPLGYPEDLVNAILAVRQADLPYVDASRVAVLGRSMGGGVALNAVAAQPDLVDALVLYAPVSSSAVDTFDRWVRGNERLGRQVVETYGLPEDNPDVWQEASSRSYLGRIDVPVQIHHGTADDICPVTWSRETAFAMLTAGVAAELFEYPGEGHAFDAAWSLFMRRSVAFLDEHV